jgi:two-component system sensor histidine kinase CpxA
MRSILVTILLWSLGTIVLSTFGLWAIGKALERDPPRRADPVLSLVGMLEEDARQAFEKDGPAGLAVRLRQLDARLPGERYLVDAAGRDLVDGTDRSALIRSIGPGPARLPDGRFAMITEPREGRYRFIWITEPWFNFAGPTPFIAVVVAINALMGTLLALYLSHPLRRLRQTMDRFGRGDLQARVGSRRRDEIGVVSREFDLLAERIETLMTAERRLLQDVSHELRSPLTRLDVAVDLAIKRESRSPLLDRIRRDITRLSDLVGELLDLSRAEADSAGLVEVVHPSDLLRSLVADCSLEAEAKDCRFEFNAEWFDAIRGDSELLRRAFENVLRNAIRHAPDGSPIEVLIETCGPEARIAVRDFGPGVPDEALSSIFKPFFRVEADRSRESGGVGLGLAIARRAVEVHGGKIAARNARPGLKVEIVLPTGRTSERRSPESCDVGV